jgi:hypothetical protein
MFSGSDTAHDDDTSENQNFHFFFLTQVEEDADGNSPATTAEAMIFA